MTRLYIDLSHTAHTRARTGIQRVARALQTELARDGNATPVTWDPYARIWRELETWETANLASLAPASKRGARWPWTARLRGRLGLRRPTPLPAGQGLIEPELFSPAVAAALPRLATTGPRVALFHDALALKLPEMTPANTIGRFPAYLQELLTFDGVAAISQDSRQTLLDYWRWLGIAQPPPVETIPLGLEVCSVLRYKPDAAAEPVVLCVGTIEGRKNHLVLLEACERLWARQLRFTLHLIGAVQPQTGQAAVRKIRALQAAGRPLRFAGPATEAELEQAYAACAFTVYPSLMEGFGLPVLESLARGKPCVCSDRGALGESARGGGTMPVDPAKADAMTAAIEELLRQPAKLAQLAREAGQRRFRSWADYAADLRRWMDTLR
ncbi:MAG: glycosyltransferase family 4 protein [Opitutales bacterium]